MKNLKSLIWLTQLGLNVALPPLGFVYLAIRLQSRFGLGNWVVLAAVVLGLLCGIDGLLRSLRSMDLIGRGDKKTKPPVSFNDHD